MSKRGFEKRLVLTAAMLPCPPTLLITFMFVLAWCAFSSCLTAAASSSTSSSSWPKNVLRSKD
jgi:hypothetical protein